MPVKVPGGHHLGNQVGQGLCLIWHGSCRYHVLVDMCTACIQLAFCNKSQSLLHTSCLPREFSRLKIQESDVITSVLEMRKLSLGERK